MLTRFNLAGLHEFDGGALRVAFDQAVEQVQADCIDRPNVGQARKVTLTLQLTPVLPDHHRDPVTETQASFDLQVSMPKRSSRTHTLAAQAHGLPAFNDLSPTNPGQTTLDQVGEAPGTVHDTTPAPEIVEPDA